jgi:hypothetical protein
MFPETQTTGDIKKRRSWLDILTEGGLAAGAAFGKPNQQNTAAYQIGKNVASIGTGLYKRHQASDTKKRQERDLATSTEAANAIGTNYPASTMLGTSNPAVQAMGANKIATPVDPQPDIFGLDQPTSSTGAKQPPQFQSGVPGGGGYGGTPTVTTPPTIPPTEPTTNRPGIGSEQLPMRRPPTINSSWGRIPPGAEPLPAEPTMPIPEPGKPERPLVERVNSRFTPIPATEPSGGGVGGGGTEPEPKEPPTPTNEPVYTPIGYSPGGGRTGGGGVPEPRGGSSSSIYYNLPGNPGDPSNRGVWWDENGDVHLPTDDTYMFAEGGRVYGKGGNGWWDDAGVWHPEDNSPPVDAELHPGETVVPDSKLDSFVTQAATTGQAPDPAFLGHTPPDQQRIQPPAKPPDLETPGTTGEPKPPVKMVAPGGAVKEVPQLQRRGPAQPPPLGIPGGAPALDTPQRDQLPPMPTLPQQKEPKFWRRLVAGGIGAATALTAARGGGRMDTSGAIDQVLYPGRNNEIQQYNQQMAARKLQMQEMKDQAEMDRWKSAATNDAEANKINREKLGNQANRFVADPKSGAIFDRDLGTYVQKPQSEIDKLNERAAWAKSQGWTRENNPNYDQFVINNKIPETPKPQEANNFEEMAVKIWNRPELPPEEKQKQISQMLEFQKQFKATTGGAQSIHWVEDKDGTVRAVVATPSEVSAEGGQKSFGQIGKPQAATSEDPSDAKEVARAIIAGEQPPLLTGLYRNTMKVKAELARAGYNQTVALSDWNAVQRHLTTLNGAQQERLRQAIQFTYDSVDIIEGLYKEWDELAKGGALKGFKEFNRGNLALAKQLPGRAGAVANNLESQINDLTSELGTVYRGGNASTDESLKLAAGNLKSNWNKETFDRALGLVRTNLTIRKNSIMTSKAVGVSPGSPYQREGDGTTGAGTAAPTASTAVGTIVNGMRFKGGDRMDPKNWEKVK